MDVASREAAGRPAGMAVRRHPPRGRGAGLASWTALVVVAVAVAALGFIGFTRFEEARTGVQPVTTRLYLTVQLFLFSSGSVLGPVPWELDVARLAAPIVAAYAVVRVLAALFREQASRLLLRFRRGHVVVAGLGRKGASLVAGLLDRGDRVVAIEADAARPEVRAARAMGALVIVGDARLPATQARAGVGRASELAVLCGDDATNLEVVVRAREQVAAGRGSSLHCVVDLESQELGRLLYAAELARYGEAPLRIDFVNVHAAGARALLAAHPPCARADGGLESVLVVGGGRTARQVLVELARGTALGMRPGTSPVQVTLLGAHAGSLAELARRYPEVRQLTDLRAVRDSESLLDAPAPGIAYVCPDDEEAAALAALELRVALAGHPTRIVAVLASRTGLGELLDAAPGGTPGPSIVSFGLLEAACRPEALLAGTSEVLARALHAAYVEEVRAAASPDDPALRPWAALPESLRESNRDQGAHVAVKLAAVGRTVAPLIDWSAAREPFAPSEVETMARLEHERWVAERRRAGWQPGPRDPERRTTPYLVPWGDLAEDVREKDRLFIRQLPRLLASVGLQALRGADARPPKVSDDLETAAPAAAATRREP